MLSSRRLFPDVVPPASCVVSLSPRIHDPYHPLFSPVAVVTIKVDTTSQKFHTNPPVPFTFTFTFTSHISSAVLSCPFLSTSTSSCSCHICVVLRRSYINPMPLVPHSPHTLDTSPIYARIWIRDGITGKLSFPSFLPSFLTKNVPQLPPLSLLSHSYSYLFHFLHFTSSACPRLNRGPLSPPDPSSSR